MSDWAVGDLARCLMLGLWRNCQGKAGAGPKRGEVCRVMSMETTRWGLAFTLDAYDGNKFLATRFRKIRPDAHEECEEEFTKLVRRKSAPSPQERHERILEALFPGVPASPPGQSGYRPEPVSRLGHAATVPNAERGE